VCVRVRLLYLVSIASPVAAEVVDAEVEGGDGIRTTTPIEISGIDAGETGGDGILVEADRETVGESTSAPVGLRELGVVRVELAESGDDDGDGATGGDDDE
jgi:hypothetical protein